MNKITQPTRKRICSRITGAFCELNPAMAGQKIGPRGGHVWLTSYPGPRGFSCLFAALVLSSHAEKNQEKPLRGTLRPEYLRVDFLHIIGILYIFL